MAKQADPTTVEHKPDPEFEALEKETQREDNRPVTASEMRAFGQEISRGITEGMRSLLPRKVSFGDFMRRIAPKVKLKWFVVQNGREVPAHQLNDTERACLNKIGAARRSGRYLQRRVEIIVHVNPVDENERVIDIRYPDGKIDTRIENARYFSGFEDLVRKASLEIEVAQENEKAGTTLAGR